MKKLPLISCLMVTRCTPDRFQYFRESVFCFCRQDYPNKELVIVHDLAPRPDQLQYLQFIKSLKRRDIRWIPTKDKLKLGGLRNRSVKKAKGEVFCTWDDDDIYHRRRLSAQFEVIKSGEYGAVVLTDVYHLFRVSGVVQWLDLQKKPPYRSHIGSLMVHKKFMGLYPATGKMAHRYEDMPHFGDLIKKTDVALMSDSPGLYVYCSHGGNVTGSNYIRWLFARPLAKPVNFLKRNKKRILRELSELPISDPILRIQSISRLAFIAVDDSGKKSRKVMP